MKRALAATSLLLCVARPASATPGHSYGFGSRASALGGAVTANSADPSALFYNPAALSLARETQLCLGYRGVSSQLETNQRDAGIAGLGTIEGALLGRGELLGVPVGFGLGLALGNGHLSRTRSIGADEPHWALRETLPELLDLATGLALRPARWLALGAGAGFLATTRGGFEVEGSAVLSDGQGAEYDSRLRHSVDAELVSVHYLVLGAELLLPRALSPLGASWRVGLSFRDEAKLEQQLRGTLEGTVDAGVFQVPVRYGFDSYGLVAFQPRQLVLGLAAERGATRAGLDLGWEQWSRYPSPIARSAAHVVADAPAGLGLSLPPDSELPPADSAGFEDRFTLRLGAEQQLELSPEGDLYLRAGYAYLPTPSPQSSDRGKLLDASEHVFSLGAGVALWELSRYLPRGVALDAYGSWSRLPNFRQERDGTYFAKGNVYSAGLGLSLSFERR